MDFHFAYGTGLGLVTRLVAAGAASFCVAGVALGDMDFHFVWQAWHLATGPSLCVAGVALGDIDLHFVWQAWHLCNSAGSGDALGCRERRIILCGRRGTWRHRPSLCVAGVALTALGWVWWRAASFCVAGVALGDMDLHFVWQASRLATFTFTLCGRCGTYGTGLGLVARLLPRAPHHSAWQAWHLVTWTFTLCGRRGTWRHGLSLGRRGTYGTGLGLVTRLVAAGAASFCVAGVELGDMDFHFVGQAWHLATSTFTLCAAGVALCGTYGTGLGLVARLVAARAASFWVAGVALGDMDLHFVWQAWHLATSTFTLCGRRGTYGTGLCVAGVALGDIDFHFVWQAWHLRHWAGSGDALGCRGRRVILRGRRGTW
eukprot:s141_g29.t1